MNKEEEQREVKDPNIIKDNICVSVRIRGASIEEREQSEEYQHMKELHRVLKKEEC